MIAHERPTVTSPVDSAIPRSPSALSTWQLWACLSACCAALTAIFGKVGVEEINSNFATLIRTVFILGVTAAIVALSHARQPLSRQEHQPALANECFRLVGQEAGH